MYLLIVTVTVLLLAIIAILLSGIPSIPTDPVVTSDQTSTTINVDHTEVMQQVADETQSVQQNVPSARASSEKLDFEFLDKTLDDKTPSTGTTSKQVGSELVSEGIELAEVEDYNV